MKICKTCKWWHKEPCTKDWGHCTKTAVDEGKPVCPDSKAQAWDVEGFYTVLQTREDFGCVQWEAREEEV